MQKYLAQNYLARAYHIVRNYPTCEITARSSERVSGKTDATSRCHCYKVNEKCDPAGGSRRVTSPPAGVGRLLTKVKWEGAISNLHHPTKSLF